jgi:hypothetical protein
MDVCSSSAKGAIQAWGKSLAMKEYDGDPKKVAIAEDAFGLGTDYIRSMPKGWNINNTHEEFHARCCEHIKANINTKPYGFIVAVPVVGFFIMQIIGGIISWAVGKLLEMWYDKHIHK